MTGTLLPESQLPSSLRATLPGRYYTDADIFAQEQESIFESMWCCAIRSSDLTGPGAFRTVQVGRESVIVSRIGTGRSGRS